MKRWRFLSGVYLIMIPLLASGQPDAVTQSSLPLRHLHLTSAFGCRVHPITRHFGFHTGVDLAARQDTVYAVAAGVVCFAGWSQSSLGVLVRMRHAGETVSIYGHLSRYWVTAGDTLLAGEPIGLTGAIGRVTGEHLHFAVQYRNHFINPLTFLKALLSEGTANFIINRTTHHE